MHEFELQYPEGLRVHWGLTEEGLLEFQTRLDLNRRDIGTGWVSYQLPPLRDGGMVIGVELSFYGGSLKSLSVFHSDEAAYGSGWGEWSAEKEELRARRTREWLSSRGFPVGKYGWGEVRAVYDPKSGFGAGVVRFGKT